MMEQSIFNIESYEPIRTAVKDFSQFWLDLPCSSLGQKIVVN